MTQLHQPIRCHYQESIIIKIVQYIDSKVVYLTNSIYAYIVTLLVLYKETKSDYNCFSLLEICCSCTVFLSSLVELSEVDIILIFQYILHYHIQSYSFWRPNVWLASNSRSMFGINMLTSLLMYDPVYIIIASHRNSMEMAD